MKPAALLLWLTLFGGDPSTEPSALAIERPAVQASAWVGQWLVGQRREQITAQFTPVAGRPELTGVLKFGTDLGELWIGRLEGGRLRLNRAGVGEARLTATQDGRLVGRLSRRNASGNVELLKNRDEASARPSP
jgi:hypothetical protein